MKSNARPVALLVLSLLLAAGAPRDALAQVLWSSRMQSSWHWGGAATTAQSYASGSWDGGSYLRVRQVDCTEQSGGLSVDFPSQYRATGRRHAGFTCRIGPRFTDCRPHMKLWWLMIYDSSGTYQHRRGLPVAGGWHDDGNRMLPKMGFGGVFWPANDEFGNQYFDAPENSYTFDYDDYENEWLYVEFGYVTGGTMTLSIWNRSGTLAKTPLIQLRETDHDNTDDVTQPGDYAHAIQLSAYTHSVTGSDADSYIDYSELYYGSAAMGPPPGFLTGGNSAPSIAITGPTSSATYSTTSASIALGGTASDSDGTVASVTWVNDRGGSGTATGTTTWSVATVSLQSGANVITVTARDNGGRTATDTLTVTYNSPDTTAPTCAINSPTSSSTYQTSSPTVSLGGTASDNIGVTQVTWVNDRGGSGTAAGTSTWTAASVALQSGANVLTVTARDAAGNTGTDTLTVTYTPPAGGTAVDITNYACTSLAAGSPTQNSGAAPWAFLGNGYPSGDTRNSVDNYPGYNYWGLCSYIISFNMPSDFWGSTVGTDCWISFQTRGATNQYSKEAGNITYRYYLLARPVVNFGSGSRSAGVPNWNEWSAGNAWQAGGANGAPSDRSGTACMVVTGPASAWTRVGESKVGVTFDATMRAQLQNWANNRNAYYGFVCIPDASPESVIAVQSWKLHLDYSRPSDQTAPTCAITSPTSSATYATASSTASLGGTASDNVGVTQVTWANDRGGSGTASGTTSWTVASIALQSGANVLTVTARDAAGNTASDTLTVTYTPPSVGDGLRAVYYDNADFTGTTVTRTDPQVNFDWGSGAPASGIGAETFSVRWTGKVMPQYGETYTFYTRTDDGARLWVNGQLLVNQWKKQSATEYSGTISLSAGVKYDITMEYYDNTGNAVAQLRWSSASTAKAIIPQSRLFSGTGPSGAPVANEEVAGTDEVGQEGPVAVDPAEAGIEMVEVWPNVLAAGRSATIVFPVLGETEGPFVYTAGGRQVADLSEGVVAGGRTAFAEWIPGEGLAQGFYLVVVTTGRQKMRAGVLLTR